MFLDNVVNRLPKAKVRSMSQRHRFSQFLPYIAYDSETKLYFNQDETVGYLWECVPLIYAGSDTFEMLEGLLNMGLPEGTCLQFILYADSHYWHLVEGYKGDKRATKDNALLNSVIESTAEFYLEAKDGLPQCQGIPIRNFRLFVTMKFDRKYAAKNNPRDLRDAVFEILKGCQLFPAYVGPEELIRTLAEFFNDREFNKIESLYDESKEIKDQIILSETAISNGWSSLKIGDKVMKCMSPKKMPSEVGVLLMNYVCGDIWGMRSDTNQIQVPFLICINIVIDKKIKPKLHAKCNFLLQQEFAGSLAPSLARKQSEYLWATDEIEKGTAFVRVIPTVWVMAKDDDTAGQAFARTRRLWESKGAVMQEEKGLLDVMFLASLPFGLYNVGDNIEMIGRDMICDASSAVKCLPVQGDFRGTSSPVLMFLGRKGQIVGVDLFDKNANNQNLVIAAESGSGKSFLMNYLVTNYLASGAAIRMIDVGGSYEKLCNVVGGRYVSFKQDSGICLNPFTHIEDIDFELPVLSTIVSEMIFSSTDTEPSETEMTLIKSACRDAWDKKGKGAEIEDVFQYLASIKGNLDDKTIVLARQLAFNMQDFTKNGVYGRWFSGPATLDIAHDKLVVLELEELKPLKELFNVVILQLMNYMTQDLYLSDRSIKKIIVFDESWQFLSGDETAQGNMLKSVINEAYRRARKYNGSVVTITQSIKDFQGFGRVGDAILGNSAFKFLLASRDYGWAVENKILTYNQFVTKILESVRSMKGNYSEIFMETPGGSGVGRLVVDPYSYYLYTSDPNDNAKLQELTKTGMPYSEAIRVLADKRRETLRKCA